METLCCGTGGIEELRRSLPDENAPCYGMLRLTVGEGAFSRQKVVLITLSPDSCSGIKKAKFQAKKNDVKKIIGDVHTEWVVSVASELTLTGMLEATKHIAADSTKGEFSIAKMKADYEAMIQTSSKVGGGGAKIDLAKGAGRKTAAEMGTKIASNIALKAVREPMGPFNWVLFGPSEAGADLQFINAGSLSINECVKWLKDDENYYGLLRMGFGEGRFRRTKWIFFTFSGPKVGVVKRSKAASAKSYMKSALGPCSIDLQVTSLDELTLKDVIDKVRKLPGVEGEQVTDSNEINIDNFMKALSEEAKAAAGFFGDDASGAPASGRGRSAAQVVDEIRKAKGANWALFTVDSLPAVAGGVVDGSVLGVAGVPLPSTAGGGATALASAPTPSAGGARAPSPATAASKPVVGKLQTGSWITKSAGGDSKSDEAPSVKLMPKPSGPPPTAAPSE